MTAKEFLPIFHGFADVRNLKKTRVAADLWFHAFKDMTKEQFAAAIIAFSRESTEYPTPAAVRRFAGIYGMSNAERAIYCWGKVLKAVRCYGSYTTVSFSDPLVNAAINMIGGWCALCETSTDKMDFKGAEFRKAYETCARTGVGDPSPGRGIPGFTDNVSITIDLPQHPAQQRLLARAAPRLELAGLLKGPDDE